MSLSHTHTHTHTHIHTHTFPNHASLMYRKTLLFWVGPYKLDKQSAKEMKALTGPQRQINHFLKWVNQIIFFCLKMLHEHTHTHTHTHT